MHCACCLYIKVDLIKDNLIDDMSKKESVLSNKMGNVKTEAQYIFGNVRKNLKQINFSVS